MFNVITHVCGPIQNNVYLLIDADTAECAVIDPAMDSAAVIDDIERRGLSVRYVLLTHGHFDHAYAAAGFCSRFNAPLAVHPLDAAFLDQLPATCEQWGFPAATAPPVPQILLAHGQHLQLGAGAIEVRHTPGHSPGQVAFIAEGHALVGDTLFYRAIGRYDLPGSNYDDLRDSILEQLYTLPGETIVWPGHGPQTTIDQERRLNPYFGDSARFQPVN